jgi:DNA-binding NtrC family response regulator
MPSSITATPSFECTNVVAQPTSHLRETVPGFVGRDEGFLELLQRVERYARHEHATVLIEGESGTGKSYIARHLHASSPRARGVYQHVILSALDDNLASSDLFGHLSGAYTDAKHSRPGHFVSANRGTLFLDEIGKASAAVQRKLLHAIEHREVWPVGADRPVRIDVRLVLATNVPLEQLVNSGSFLDDLAARLLTFRLRLPPLRERRADIPHLVHQFVELRAASCGHASPPRVGQELMVALQKAEWPHNLRQLDGVVQRLLIEADSGERELGLRHCVADLSFLRRSSDTASSLTPEDVRARARELGSKAAVGRSLGISRSTVYRYLERAGDSEAAGG